MICGCGGLMFRRFSRLYTSYKDFVKYLKVGGDYRVRICGKLEPFEPPNRYKVAQNRWPVFAWIWKLVKIFGSGHSAASEGCFSHIVKMNFRPPEAVREMKTLDKSVFKTTVQVPGLKMPSKSMQDVMKKLKKDLLSIRGVKAIVTLEDGDPLKSTHKLILLDPEKHPDVDTFSPVQMELFKENEIDLDKFCLYDVDLGYENWTADVILRAVLPEDRDNVSGFSTIGHILHLNLKSYHEEFKEIIGEVLLDKVNNVQTVVNKLDVIDNTFRNFSMEVLAGEPNFITTTKENGCTFEMDFSKVYWNPRLSTEHQRIVDQLQVDDLVYDVFAGIGPFTIPATKKKCTVLANDLNPESFKWLEHNVKKNKIKSGVSTYNFDGRDFIREILKPDLVKRLASDGKFDRTKKIHIVMNLPALAIEFLDVFHGLLQDVDLENFVEPIVHCYNFSKEEDATRDVRERAESFLGAKLPADHAIRIVRHVAPNKDMYCAEFRLEKHILFQKSDSQEPAAKRLKQDQGAQS